MDIPSYLVKGDMIEVKESSRSSAKVQRLTRDAPTVLVPKWLERDKNALKAPCADAAREDIDLPVEEHLIVELYWATPLAAPRLR